MIFVNEISKIIAFLMGRSKLTCIKELFDLKIGTLGRHWIILSDIFDIEKAIVSINVFPY